MNARALPVAVAAAAAAAIAASLGFAPFVVLAIFKPLATVLILLQALRCGAGRWIAAGLGLSLVGDIALLWPGRGFLPGLVAFLLAHAGYLVAFTRRTRLAARILPFVAYALVAGGILSVLWPDVPPALRVPVVAYVVFLSAMAAQAAVAGGRVLALGGALFVASDALLATNKFHGGVPLASLWILATYWAAQWCIATGASRPAPGLQRP